MVTASFWRAYRPPRADVMVAAVFVLLGQLVTWGQWENPEAFAGPRLSNAILNALLMAAIAWRRRAPLAAVCWAAGVYFLPHAVLPHDMTFSVGALPLIVLTASAAYSCPRHRAVIAAVVALVALVVVTVTTPELRSPGAFVINTGFVVVPWLAARGLREREQRAATLAVALAQQQAAQDAALREVAGAERAHIARELHDIVAHSVSMMVIQVGAARMQLQTEPQAAAGPLLEAEEVGRQTLDDLRRLLGVLRADERRVTADRDCGQDTAVLSAEPPQPGLVQLDALLEPVRAAGLSVAVQVTGEPVALPAALDLTAYRVVQEALTNALKHARASCAEVRLAYSASALTIDIIDAGRSCSAADERPPDGAGHGLIGIRERVSMFGGTMAAGPSPEGGWRLQVELPLPVSAVPPQRATAVPAS